MKLVQQLTCLTLDRLNGPAYSTDELLNMPLVPIKFDENHHFRPIHQLCVTRIYK